MTPKLFVYSLLAANAVTVHSNEVTAFLYLVLVYCEYALHRHRPSLHGKIHGVLSQRRAAPPPSSVTDPEHP